MIVATTPSASLFARSLGTDAVGDIGECRLTCGDHPNASIHLTSLQNEASNNTIIATMENTFGQKGMPLHAYAIWVDKMLEIVPNLKR